MRATSSIAACPSLIAWFVDDVAAEPTSMFAAISPAESSLTSLAISREDSPSLATVAVVRSAAVTARPATRDTSDPSPCGTVVSHRSHASGGDGATTAESPAAGDGFCSVSASDPALSGAWRPSP